MSKVVKPSLNTINDLRRELGKMGYGVKTQRMSWGQHATFLHKASCSELTGNVFTPETIKKWQALFDWQRANQTELKKLKEKTNIFGLFVAGEKSNA